LWRSSITGGEQLPLGGSRRLPTDLRNFEEGSATGRDGGRRRKASL